MEYSVVLFPLLCSSQCPALVHTFNIVQGKVCTLVNASCCLGYSSAIASVQCSISDVICYAIEGVMKFRISLM